MGYILFAPSLLAAGLVCLVILLSSGFLPSIQQFLGCKLFCVLDPWTYAIYLTHVPLIELAASHSASPFAVPTQSKLLLAVIGLGACAAIILLGGAFHVLFEQPWVQLLSYLSHKPPRAPVEMRNGL